MKILVLCYEYPPVGGGGGRAARSIAEELVARGHEVRVQTAGMRHLPRLERLNGVEIHRAESFRRREDSCSVAEMGLYLATSFFPAIDLVRRWKPDVIHAHFAVPTGALAYALHRLTGVPYVLTVHLGDVPGGVPEQTDRLFRYLKRMTVPIWRRASAIAAVSEFIRELVVAAYGRPVIRIPNGIRLAPGAGELEVANPVRLIAVGRFNPQKNFVFLMDALNRLKDLNWELVMIGDGPTMPQVRNRAAQYGLESRIRFEGWLDGCGVTDRLRQADLLLMPSLSEGMPVAAIEALNAGVAIAGSEIGGLRDVIEPGVNGVRVLLDEPRSFAEAVRKLIEDRPALLHLKEGSRKKAQDFDLRLVAEEYERVLLKSAPR